MRDNKNNNTLVGAMAAIILGLLIFAFMFRGPLDDEQKVRKEIAPPEQAIDIKIAAQLQQEYVRTRADSINTMLDKVDTRDFWFSLETMEQYIDYVKSEGEKKGYKDMGIRIFYAAYPQDSRDPRADPGYSTVVLVPTKGKPSMGNGFFPMPPVQETAGGINALNYGQGGRPPKNVE